MLLQRWSRDRVVVARVGAQATLMSQQVIYRHFPSPEWIHNGESAEMQAHRIMQSEELLLDQLHHGRRDICLRKRARAPRRTERHRHLACQVCVPKALFPQKSAAVRDS
jgi:hypothetical protein